MAIIQVKLDSGLLLVCHLLLSRLSTPIASQVSDSRQAANSADLSNSTGLSDILLSFSERTFVIDDMS